MSIWNNSINWRRPRAHHEQEENRKISWLELFYDLVYVAVIFQLTHALAHHLDFSGSVYFFLLIVPIYWSWVNSTYHHDFHGRDDMIYRFFTFLQLLTMGVMAVTITKVQGGNYRPFALAYAFHHFIITYLWFRVWYYDREHGKLLVNYLYGYSIAVILFVISVFFPMKTAVSLWILAMGLNLIIPFIQSRVKVDNEQLYGLVLRPSFAAMERFGLLTIIVLGETILEIVIGFTELTQIKITSWIIFFLAISISSIIWSLYFDIVADWRVKKGYWRMLIWNYVHLPLIACIAAVGASLRFVIVNGKVSLVLPISLAGILFSLAVIVYLLDLTNRYLRMKRIFASIMMVAGLVLMAYSFVEISIGYYLSFLVLIMFLPVLYLLYVKSHYSQNQNI